MAHVKTDEERGQPGAWLYHARNALGLSHGQVAAANDVSVSAIVKAEGKRPPEGQASRSLQDRLIAYYRSLARERPDVLLPELPPDRESSDRGGSAAPDLVAALEAQTAAIDRQVESLDRLARAIEVGSTRVLGGVEGQGKLLARLVDALSRGGTLNLDELELHGVPER